MEKILKLLYHGGIRPLERSCPTDPDYLELQSQYDGRHDVLVDMLNEQGQELLEELIDIRIQLDRYADEDAFIYGFKLGAKIMLEGLEDTK